MYVCMSYRIRLGCHRHAKAVFEMHIVNLISTLLKL